MSTEVIQGYRSPLSPEEQDYSEDRETPVSEVENLRTNVFNAITTEKWETADLRTFMVKDPNNSWSTKREFHPALALVKAGQYYILMNTEGKLFVEPIENRANHCAIVASAEKVPSELPLEELTVLKECLEISLRSLRPAENDN